MAKKQQVGEVGVEVSFLETKFGPRTDETSESARRDQRLTQRFLWLFRDSFQTSMQQTEAAMTSRGEQQKWCAVLRDAHGQVVHSPGNVLLNPMPLTSSNVPNSRPFVQLVLPNKLDIDRALTLPVAHLMCESQPDHQQRAAQLFDTFFAAKNQHNGPSAREAMAQYRLIHATIDPTRPQDLRRGMETIVSLTTGQQPGKEARLLVDQLLQLHPLYRITHHPDVGATGRQRIEQTTIPLAYKGVSLQPGQIRNLLLGNTIEVAGIRDPRRGSLYRAGVSFNILHGQPDEVSRREQLKTDNKPEAVVHRKLVDQQDDDQIRNGQVRIKKQPGTSSGNVPSRLPKPFQA